jgi:hypothetical protein
MAISYIVSEKNFLRIAESYGVLLDLKIAGILREHYAKNLNDICICYN